MSFYEKTCGGCGSWVAIGPEQTNLVRWCGSVLKRGWWVHGRCPLCDDLLVEHQVSLERDAHEMIGEGATVVLFSRPAELDDNDHHILVSPLDADTAGDLASAIAAADEATLDDELLALIEVYGS